MLVGDVWLSSGQSNLTFRMVPNPPWSMGVLDYEKEVAAANNPKLRFFTVITGASHQPEKEAFGIWQTTTPQNVRFISAISYFFAAEIQRRPAFPSVFSCRAAAARRSSSGCRRNPWKNFRAEILHQPRRRAAGKSGRQHQSERAETGGISEKKFREAIATTGKVPSWPEPFPHYETAPGALYNGMIAPLARVPVCGFIYCQGESDSQSASTYTAYFKELITSRQALFNEPDAPFLFVQIANFDVAAARKAPPEKVWRHLGRTTRSPRPVRLKLSRTGMAVSADVGEALAVHPRDKKTVGHRSRSGGAENCLW